MTGGEVEPEGILRIRNPWLRRPLVVVLGLWVLGLWFFVILAEAIQVVRDAVVALWEELLSSGAFSLRRAALPWRMTVEGLKLAWRGA